MDNFTVLAIPLAESSDAIQAFRKQHVHRPAVAMPPHISIQYPFYPVEEISEMVQLKLQAIAASHLPISYSLSGFGVFPQAKVLYLEPIPSEPFLLLYETIKKTFPDLKSAFDPPTMHLTIAHAEAAVSLEALKMNFLDHEGINLPVQAKAESLDLYEKKNGVWNRISEYKNANKSVVATADNVCSSLRSGR